MLILFFNEIKSNKNQITRDLPFIDKIFYKNVYLEIKVK